MRYNYYYDYTKAFRLARRVYAFIERIKQDGSTVKFDFFECCKYLRWNPYPRDKHKQLVQTSIRNDYADEIEYILRILGRIEAIEKYEFEPLRDSDTKKVNNYRFIVMMKNIDSWDELVKSSQYFPLEGYPQTITAEFLEKKKAYYDITYYHKILDDCKKSTYRDTALAFKKLASDEWQDKYEIMKGHPLEDMPKSENDFEFYLDLGYVKTNERGQTIEQQNERVVAIAGFSKTNNSHRKRDINRLAGYRKRFFSEWADKETDTGHYIAHTIWGFNTEDPSNPDAGVDLEFNLFPQKRNLNQGHSEEGKLYRRMEHYCAENNGVFLFVRPIYGDSSDRPYILEYGILKPDLTLWIEQFVNI